MPQAADAAVTRHRWTAVGIAAALVAFLAASTVTAATTRPWSGDEVAHVGYAFQVWNGRLPVFEEGVRVTPPRGASVPRVQWTSHHPPLYYLIAAPLLGPAVSAEDWGRVAILGRMLSAGFGALTVAGSAWVGWLIGGRRRSLWAVTVAGVVAAVWPLQAVSGAIYNDTAGTALTAFALGLAVLIVRRGPTRGLVIAAAAVAAAGMATRISFAVTVGVLVLAIVIGATRDEWSWPALLRAAAAAAAVAAGVIVTSGWFYARNMRLTGSVVGRQLEWGMEVQGRVTRSISEVLTDPGFWTLHLDLFPPAGTAGHLLRAGLIVGLPVVGLAAAARMRYHVDWNRMLIPLLLLGQAAGTELGRISHLANAGGNHHRYLLGFIVPVAAAITAGALSLRKRNPPAVAMVIVTVWGLYFAHAVSTGLLRLPEGVGDTPGALIRAALAVALIAVVVVVVALVRLSNADVPTPQTARELVRQGTSQ